MIVIGKCFYFGKTFFDLMEFIREFNPFNAFPEFVVPCLNRNFIRIESIQANFHFGMTIVEDSWVVVEKLGEIPLPLCHFNLHNFGNKFIQVLIHTSHILFRDVNFLMTDQNKNIMIVSPLNR